MSACGDRTPRQKGARLSDADSTIGRDLWAERWPRVRRVIDVVQLDEAHGGRPELHEAACHCAGIDGKGARSAYQGTVVKAAVRKRVAVEVNDLVLVVPVVVFLRHFGEDPRANERERPASEQPRKFVVSHWPKAARRAIERLGQPRCVVARSTPVRGRFQNMTVCYLCSLPIANDRGDDHVPPKQFFAPAVRKTVNLSKLITLPAHRTCNAAYSLDEEYFTASFAPIVMESPS